MIYKLTIWQYRISVFCAILFLIFCILWLITDYSRLEPLTVLVGGISALSALIWPKPNYGNKRLKGRDSFNYSSNSGLFIIGSGEMTFGTQWTKRSDVNIYLYNDDATIESIALANNVTSFKDVKNATAFDFSSRYITIHENEIAALKNINGSFALIRVVDVKDSGCDGDDRDELTIEWIINPKNKTDFS